MTLEEKISRTLLQLRRSDPLTKLSQKDVAEDAGITPEYYGKIENGKNKVTVHVLEKIAGAFGMKLSEICKLIEEQS